MEVGGGLRVLKQCGSKPPLMTLQSRAYIASNLREACGNKIGVRPCLDPKDILVNERRIGG
jgi:hypothetical protein